MEQKKFRARSTFQSSVRPAAGTLLEAEIPRGNAHWRLGSARPGASLRGLLLPVSRQRSYAPTFRLPLDRPLKALNRIAYHLGRVRLWGLSGQVAVWLKINRFDRPAVAHQKAHLPLHPVQSPGGSFRELPLIRV
jgi:hypothetical protein